VLEPLQHIAGADKNDDHLQARIPWQHALENLIEGASSHARARNVANVHTIGAQRLEVLRPFEQSLQRPRPRGVLIEKVALGLAATGDENPEQMPCRSRQIVAALSLSVDVEADKSLELRQGFSIGFET